MSALVCLVPDDCKLRELKFLRFDATLSFGRFAFLLFLETGLVKKLDIYLSRRIEEKENGISFKYIFIFFSGILNSTLAMP